MIRINTTITASQKETIKKESESTGLGQADIIRRAIDAYFEERKNERPIQSR